MLNLLGGFRSYLAAGAVLAFVGWSGAIYLKGLSDGAEKGRIEQLEKTLQVERDRKDIDNETENLGDVELCRRLGGMPDDCDAIELRGLDATTDNQ